MSCESLPYCLSCLSAAADDPAGLSRALCALRNRHVSRARGLENFRKSGGLVPLLALFTDPARAAVLGTSRRNLELALSLLANSCTEPESRVQVLQLGGIPALVCILQSVCVDSVWNRVCRALGNLAVEPRNSLIIHQSGAVSSLIHILQTSQDAGCLQSVLRALRILGDSRSHRLYICERGGLSPCVTLLSSQDPTLVCAAVRTVCELSRGCSLDCAEKLSVAVPVLITLGGGEDVKPEVRQAAISTLCNLCGQGALRPLLGNAGTIQLLISEVSNLRGSPTRCLPVLKALCLCCREAVNRCRVREQGGLELLLDLLRDSQFRSVHLRITAAFLHYCHDTTALALLGTSGLAPLLAQRLEELTCAPDLRGELQGSGLPVFEEEDVASASFDFPPEPKNKKQMLEGTSEENFRSWLLSEGYICSLEDLSPEWCLDSEKKSLHISDESATLKSADLNSAPSTSSVTSDTDTLISPRMKGFRLEQRTHSSPALSQLCFSPTSSQLCPSPIHEILSSQWPLGPCTFPSMEVWGPEFPGLLLLSRFSQLSEPSSCLVSPPVLKGLLSYVTCHPYPSPQAAHLLQRLTCDPSCLEAFIRTGGICMLRARLILSETPETDREDGNRHPEKSRELGQILLRNLGIQAESAFGVGAVTHMLLSGAQCDRQQCALSLPFIYRKDSPHREQLLEAAISLVLDAMIQCEDHVFFFHASECLSSLLTPHSLLVPPCSPPGSPPHCHYMELVAHGGDDVVFVLDDGERVGGSRMVLSAGCDVFKTMLGGAYAESNQKEVRVREVPALAFIPVLHYLHGCAEGSLCPTLKQVPLPEPDQELAQSPLGSALAAAGRFLLPGLQKLLESIVRDSLLSLDTLPSVYNFAEIHESRSLRKDCCLYLLQRPHPPRKRAFCLFQLCQRAHDKKRLFQLLEDIIQGSRTLTSANQ
ncbi:armadillo repeat-containing protein 5 [Rhinophrynus dorsalis]